ncbi:chromate efflux transporter [Halomonas sp. ANAO-440]|uniref:chromate efflux transporter n=1 Tax=Halomonas sp. ANAO-440 TaxID=2861360 RepID=UPI001CAA7871|nr:chromate efflux transporter [Halomonas sp. ANAO-440]MBZ0328783.1 chromate efflux transporter [Halomonas sp. ANAO-440]
MPPNAVPHDVPFREAVHVWLRIALLSFGGPAGQIAVMHRILVEEKKWIGENRFLHALNYCMLLPGPEAQQLAIYIGWLMHRTRGGLLAGTLFVLPGFIAILALSYLYAALGNVGLVEGLFFGLKAAVLAIVVNAVVRIGKRALKNNVMLGIAAAAFVAIFFLDIAFPLIIVTAALIGYFGGRAGSPLFQVGGGHDANGEKGLADSESLLGEQLPDHARVNRAWSLKVSATFLSLWLTPVLLLIAVLGFDSVFTQIATFFSQMAVVTFGGAYAVLSYVAQAAVQNYGWLAPGEMLDGLGMAETTPGPLIQVVQFVGFMGAFRDAGTLDPWVAATFAAVLTTWVTFVPCFLWIFLGAPYVERLRDNAALSGAMTAITAAVVGVVLNLAVWFGIHVVFGEVGEWRGAGLRLLIPDLATLDPLALLLSAGAMLAIFRFKLGMLKVLGACALLGMVFSLLS